MKMTDLASRMELVAADLFGELRQAFIKQLTEEDFLTDFLIEVGSNPERYSDILDPEITRISRAYKGAMDCFLELDELAGFEYLAKQAEKPAESEPDKSVSPNRGDILNFPLDALSTPDEDDDEQG